ncbi:hypothetical protein [Evansella clarkii]|uniref:hypothetical protein n=1 Tax=Evansella clarkii TaxID=79879 RepID=UPI001116A933|nr:hypothetical protein [Evansella clarkii]
MPVLLKDGRGLLIMAMENGGSILEISASILETRGLILEIRHSIPEVIPDYPTKSGTTRHRLISMQIRLVSMVYLT